MMQDEEILEKLNQGLISPEEAVKQFELPSYHIGDIEVDLDQEPLPCGFKSFEEMHYLRKNRPDLYVLAGVPGGGKTALAAQIASQVADNLPVLFYSLEMSKEQLKERFLAQETNRAIKFLKTVPEPLLAKAKSKLKSKKLYLDDASDLDIDVICSRTIDFAKRYPLSLVLVDYVQIVPVKKENILTAQIKEIMVKLKVTARKINAPILVLSQYNRGFETRLADNPNAEPMKMDLAESSFLERVADGIYGLCPIQHGTLKLKCIKFRHGEQRDIRFEFVGPSLRFIDCGIDGGGL